MKTIRAVVVADSVSADGPRLISILMRFPWFIKLSVLRHRRLSSLTTQTHAVSTKALIGSIKRDPAAPEVWDHDCGPGAAECIRKERLKLAVSMWGMNRYKALLAAEVSSGLGMHRHIINPLLYPYMHVDALVTGTDFSVLVNPQEEDYPSTGRLSEVIDHAIKASVPRQLASGEWHVPFVGPDEGDGDQEQRVKVSAVRCERVASALGEFPTTSFEADLREFEHLTADTMATGHQARPEGPGDDFLTRNLRGWVQFQFARFSVPVSMAAD